MKITHQVWKDLAGSVYDELLNSKESAIANLDHPDRNVRVAAINVCLFIWSCTSTEFVTICRRLAATDPDDFVRENAIKSVGAAMQLGRDSSISQFLADIVKDSKNLENIRYAAYWALREIQLGLTEIDSVKRTISPMKKMLAKPCRLSEKDVKDAILFGGHFPDDVWDTADQIDWEFVNQFVSAK